jgi:hypothetical protein
MNSNTTAGSAIRVTSMGHVAFAAIMTGLGVLGLIKRDFTAVWQPVSRNVPAREVLVYLCVLISLGSGIGLLWRRTARRTPISRKKAQTSEIDLMNSFCAVLRPGRLDLINKTRNRLFQISTIDLRKQSSEHSDSKSVGVHYEAQPGLIGIQSFKLVIVLDR